MLLLLDVDGVLVHNRAYRAALQQTVAYFSRWMGVGEHAPSDAEIDVFESQSIIVEWDSIAIVVAYLLLERLKAGWAGPLVPDLWSALDQLAAQPRALPRPDFAVLAQVVGAVARDKNCLPAAAALSVLRQAAGGVAQTSALNQHTAPTMRLSPGSYLLTTLLANPHDLPTAPTTQIFQNLVLGHQLYQRHYGREPRLQGEPLLEQLDTSLLRAATRIWLMARMQAGDMNVVIYTARPSLAPTDAPGGGQQLGYTPEAEMARRLVGLERVPVMGYGKVEWYARQLGQKGSDLVKPSPVQALAAMGVALTKREIPSLAAAVALVQRGELREPLTLCANQMVHVLEDSPSSLRAVTRAVELLNKHGLNVTLVRHGIAPENSPKRATLAPVADFVHEGVNEALWALGD